MHISPELLKEIDWITEQFNKAQDEIWRVWQTQVVFTWHWWLDVALTVLPWVLWFIVRDRRRTHSLLYAGLFTMLTAMVLDLIGSSNGGWNYNTWVLPIMPEYLPWDFAVMPVMSMLFYQYHPRVTARIKQGGLRFLGNPWTAAVIFAAVGSFIAEPVFVWLGMYELAAWEYYFSFPIYILIYMAGWWLYTRKSLAQPDEK